MANKTAYMKFAGALVFTAALASSAFWAFPVVKEAGAQPAVAIAFSSCITQLLAAWFFLSSFKTFKRELRPAYFWLAAGVFLFSTVQLVPSLSVFTDILANSTSLTDGVIVSAYALSALCIFIGIRVFARRLGVKSLLTNLWFALGISLLAALIICVAPHPAGSYETGRLTFYMIFGATAWCGAFGLITMLAVLRIRRAIGPIYKGAMLWAAAAFGALALTALHETIVKIYFINSGYVANQYSLLPFLVTGVLMLWAGIAFKQTGRETLALPANASYVDVVVSLAQLVSKPAEIDTELDKVRLITSKHSADQLTPDEKTTLRGVYLNLEQYLTAKEPLHTFTKDRLRSNLPQDFAADLTAHEH
jgi:hypothetical protein